MSTKLANSSKEIKERIWGRGLTVRNWAILNGFKPDTVYHWFSRRKHGNGSGHIVHRIKNALIEQGIMNREEN